MTASGAFASLSAMPRRAVCALIAFLVSAAAFSQGPDLSKLPPAEKLAALLERFGSFQKGLKTLQADFVQTRNSSLLAHESVSRGRLFFEAPDQIRWEYESPLRMTVLIAGGVAVTYRPEEKRAERVEVSRMQRRVFHFLSARKPLDELKRYFSFTFKDPGPPGDYELILDPTSRHVRRRVKSLAVEIDRTRLLPGGGLLGGERRRQHGVRLQRHPRRREAPGRDVHPGPAA